MTVRLALATGNAKKVEELSRILDGLDVQLVTMDELGIQSPQETGTTFEANALLKARHVCARAGLPALADDSGLAVDALGGAPGVYSARYAGVDGAGADVANNAKLLEELWAVPDERRTARFVCAAALVTPDGGAWTVRGTMEGRVGHEQRGEQGFGYDPLFVSEGETRTNAELPPDEKDARSHRGRAFRAIRPLVERELP
ncbi:MAG TPA: RdgB/HAM1 family non-canonical purine NTP pyrophosphatase [Nitriliruptorales bacterium]